MATTQFFRVSKDKLARQAAKKAAKKGTKKAAAAAALGAAHGAQPPTDTSAAEKNSDKKRRRDDVSRVNIFLSHNSHTVLRFRPPRLIPQKGLRIRGSRSLSSSIPARRCVAVGLHGQLRRYGSFFCRLNEAICYLTPPSRRR